MDFSTGLPTKLVKNSLLAALLFSCTAVQATSMYKWVDEQGTVHYDQLPPSNQQSELIKPQGGQAKQTTKADNTATEIKETDGKGPETNTEPAGKTSDTAPEDEATRIKKENCKRAKTNLGLYMGQDKVRQPDGSEIVLDEEKRTQMLQETQEAIDKYCQ